MSGAGSYSAPIVAATKGAENEQPELATADDWTDIGYVALGWVRRSCSYSGATDGHTSSAYRHTNPADSHTCTKATDINTHTNPANTNDRPN